MVNHSQGWGEEFFDALDNFTEGKSTPNHSHDYEHEIFVLEGDGEAQLDDEIIPVGKDSFLFIPGGSQHTIRAKDEMKLICVVPVNVAMKMLGP